MALTPLRWMTAAVVGCVLLFSALMRREPRQRAFHWRDDSDTVRMNLSVAYNRDLQRSWQLTGPYRIGYLLDSARAAARPSLSTETRTFIDAGFPVETRKAVAAFAARALAVDRSVPRVGVDLFFLYDTVRSVRGHFRNAGYGTSALYVLSASADGRCLVVVRLGNFPSLPVEVASTIGSETAARQLLGPCAYYRAFGPPGTATSEWLKAGGWRTMVGGSWTTAARTRPDELRSTASRLFAAPSPALGFLSSGGLRCLTGDAERCDQLVFDTREAPVLTRTDVTVTRTARLGARSGGSGPLGVRQPELMSGLVRSLGRQRFEQMWRSNDPLPVAYARLQGEPFGAWASRWMVEQYGAVSAGPLVGSVTAASSLVVASGGLVLAMVGVMRRRYG